MTWLTIVHLPSGVLFCVEFVALFGGIVCFEWQRFKRRGGHR